MKHQKQPDNRCLDIAVKTAQRCTLQHSPPTYRVLSFYVYHLPKQDQANVYHSEVLPGLRYQEKPTCTRYVFE